MEFLKPRFGLEDAEVVERETLYDGFFSMEKLHYRHRQYRGGWSPVIAREVLYRGEAVGAVLYDPLNDTIGLVEQIRPGAFDDPNGPWCLEVVAGLAEKGESTEDVAWREIKEEANLVPESLEYICQYMATPGGCDERLYLYCAIANLSDAHDDINGLDEEGEDIRLLVIPADLVFEHLYDGRFNNAATMICLQWLQMNRDRLRRNGS